MQLLINPPSGPPFAVESRKSEVMRGLPRTSRRVNDHKNHGRKRSRFSGERIGQRQPAEQPVAT
jgi:hypothetical protein